MARNGKTPFMVEMDASDRELVERIADYLNLPRVVVIRLALRAYAETGNWTNTRRSRDFVLSGKWSKAKDSKEVV